MLPAYLGAIVAGDKGGTDSALVRAISFSAAMAIGLVLTFGAFALFVAPLAGSIQQYLPYVTYAMAVVLAIVGVLMIFGKGFGITRFLRPSIAPKNSFFSQVGYGITFALASLSCTIGPFVAVIATALNAQSWIGVTVSMAGYGIGMATVVFILALFAAAGNKWLVTRLRSGSQLIEKIIGILLLLVALYLANYATYELQQFEGSTTENRIIEIALVVQAFIVRSVTEAGYVFIGGFAIALIVSILIAKRLNNTRKSQE